MTGRIVKGIAGFYYVDIGDFIYECKAKGSFKNSNIKLLVGDIVDISILDEVERVGNIVHLHLRKNKIIRPAITNVDQIVIVSALSKPKLDLLSLDKLIISNKYLDIPTILVFNKLDEANEEYISFLKSCYYNAGVKMFFLSATTGEGVDELLAYLKDKLTVFSGNSGVGKSSLLNTILDNDNMLVGSISEKIGRGRHTTRHSEIFKLKHGGFIADTPGYGNIASPDIEPEELRYYFNEFIEYNSMCKFNTCSHIHEPDCLVREKLLNGSIPKDRYDNYKKIYNDLKNNKTF